MIAVFLTLSSLFILFFLYVKWSHRYWSVKNVPYREPTFLIGNADNALVPQLIFKDLYKYFKQKGYDHAGIYIFLSPLYMPIHPEYIKNVLIKNFNHFVDRGVFYNEKHEPVGAHLFNIGGTKWKHLRAKLTPTFTSGKMKGMFQTLVDCSKPMVKAMDLYVKQKEVVDMKDVSSKFTIDVIGSCAFGFECNSFEDPDAEFRKFGNNLFKGSFLQTLKFGFCLNFEETARMLGFRRFPKKITDFFVKIVEETVKYRQENNVERNDFMQLLINLKNAAVDGKDSLTMNEVSAQAFVFFAAGFETSSTTITFCLFELSLHPGIQQTVRDEVNAVLAKYDGKITYEAIGEMKYMQQVIDETLRKYPPVPFITRKCVNKHTIPETNTTIEKGTTVIISITGLHYDPEYYPEPEKFDPDRFTEENKNQMPACTYIPFGDGPRTCIGLRFGLMQTKVALTVLLKEFMFSLNSRTKLPIELDHGIIIVPKGGIWLDVTRVT